MATLNWFQNLVKKSIPSNPIIWPKLDTEIGQWRHYLKAPCLNAGAGSRNIAHLIDGELVNQDIESGVHNANIDIYSPLHKIPFADEHFNSIFCNAVLEHVVNPHEVLNEFYRVLSKNGYLYLCVPFLQPYHPDPTDYQRYTQDGLHALAEKHGFHVLEIEPVHSIYHTLGQIISIWLNSERKISYTLLKFILFPFIRNRCLYSKNKNNIIASAFRLIASKK
jgi:ubiquinone/menaquinone biosynthesis C-methylase UbiE